jgi:hypothetical protein
VELLVVREHCNHASTRSQVVRHESVVINFFLFLLNSRSIAIY